MNDHLVDLELPVTNTVEFPTMRREIARMLASLADREHQERAWIRGEFERDGTYEDLDLAVKVLFDDTMVLRDPASAVGKLLFETEVPALENLGSVLVPLVAGLDDSPDAVYLGSKEWQSVVTAAGVALATMVRHGAFA